MAMKRTRPKTLSDQLRQIIEAGPLSRYRIAKDSGVDASQLLRFMRGEGRLTNDSLDRIGGVLKLRLVSDLERKMK
jgi:transcriptional regulator with XRE-family HTH domain